MENTIVFNVENSTRENVNVANATSENNNVVNATSNESKKKTTKKMKLNESIIKRVFKDGKYKTDKFKIEEIENTIAILNEYKIALMDSNKDKNVNKLIDYAKKLKVSKHEFEKAAEKYLAMEIAA